MNKFDIKKALGTILFVLLAGPVLVYVLVFTLISSLKNEIDMWRGV
jgi:hypothetical protein